MAMDRDSSGVLGLLRPKKPVVTPLPGGRLPKKPPVTPLPGPRLPRKK
jgi:hypothetical protein